MSAPPELRLDAPAKVNLALSVGSPLPNGLHPIASWMAAVTFTDRLTLRVAEGGRSRFQLLFASEAPVPGTVDWPLEKDLVVRAHGLLEARIGRPLPVEAAVSKRIPAGAGLGGGSSDAAAMLVGLNRLFDLGIDAPSLARLGAALGSDVAFLVDALSGRPSAIVTGLGETLEPAPMAEVLHLVLILPGFGCPTGEVYRAFDELHRGESEREPEVGRVRRLSAALPVPQGAPFNDLAEPACRVRPELARARDSVVRALEIPTHVTGSGSTLFVIAPSALTCKVLARKVTALTGYAAVATRTLGGAAAEAG